MSGYVAMSRDWQDHDIFEGDEFSRRDAWAWLIAHAAWKQTKARIKGSSVSLERGELCFSQRFMAKKWRWSKSKVDRFIAVLRAEGMISTRSKTGATAGHSAGQGQSIITICNYDKFQSPLKDTRGNDEQLIGATAGQQRGKEEPNNQDNQEPKEEEESARYAFFGRTIKLKARDLDTWRKRFHAIPDLEIELYSLDAWFETQDEKLKKDWFWRSQSSLGRKCSEILERRQQMRDDGYDPNVITV